MLQYGNFYDSVSGLFCKDSSSGIRFKKYDLLIKNTNKETLPIAAAHTLEHLLATFFRNDQTYQDRVIYFGPMGCLTGMYLLLHGQYTSKDVLPLVIKAFDFVATFEGPIPGVSEIECGTYRLHNLEEARQAAGLYLDILNKADDSTLIYPE